MAGLSVDKVLKLARKYTSNIATSAEVWLARLEVESRFSSREDVEQAWSDARKSVHGAADELERVWLWGLQRDGMEEKRQIHKRLLHESMRDSSKSDMHEILLVQYVALHVAVPSGTGRQTAGQRIRFIHEIAREYHPSAKVWAKMFSLEAEDGDTGLGQVLQEVFELWRTKDEIEATVTWGRWLLRNGRGKEAMEAMVRARSSLHGTDRTRFETRWKVTLDEEAEDAVKVFEE